MVFSASPDCGDDHLSVKSGKAPLRVEKVLLGVAIAAKVLETASIPGLLSLASPSSPQAFRHFLNISPKQHICVPFVYFVLYKRIANICFFVNKRMNDKLPIAR